MKKNLRGSAHLLLILIVLIGIGALVYYSVRNGTIRTTTTLESSPTPTTERHAKDLTNWKTYQNTEYNFNIKYPDNWGIGSECDGDQEMDIITRLGPHLLKFPDSDCGTGNISSSIVIYLKAQLPVIDGNYRVAEQKVISTEDSQIYYFKLSVADRTQGGGDIILRAYTTLGSKYLIIQTGDYPSPTLEDEFNQILSTFKFSDRISKIGRITNAYQKNGNYFLDFDSVDFYLDQENNQLTHNATKECIKDKACSQDCLKQGVDPNLCLPVSDGYYVRDNEKTISNFQIDPKTIVHVARYKSGLNPETFSTGPQTTTINELANQYETNPNNDYLHSYWWITLENNIITDIEEQYVP